MDPDRWKLWLAAQRTWVLQHRLGRRIGKKWWFSHSPEDTFLRIIAR